MHKVFEPGEGPAELTDFATFLKLDIRAGTVLEAEHLTTLRKPAIRMLIDFGPGVGIRKSSAQIVEHYAPDELVGRQVLAVVNFPPRQIGPIMSEVLTLGLPDEDGAIRLVLPDIRVPDGARLS